MAPFFILFSLNILDNSFNFKIASDISSLTSYASPVIETLEGT